MGQVLSVSTVSSDLPTFENNTRATFADDTAILGVGKNNEEATKKTANSCKPDL